MANNPNAVANLKPCKPWETHNPNWRPKSRIALINDELAAKGYHPVTKTEIETNYMAMATLEESELLELWNDKSKPMLIRILAKAILSGKWFEIIEKMLDRGIGKPVQKGDITTNWKDITQSLSDWIKDIQWITTNINNKSTD